jgi:hypothetical protein
VGKYLRARSGAWKALSPLAPVIDLGLRAVSTHTWRRSHGRTVRELTDFDDRFDTLWMQASKQAPIVGERNAAFLRWRYAECPIRKYVTLALETANREQLLGYAVCYVVDDQVLITDLLTDGSDAAIDDLLTGVLSWSRRNGASSTAFHSMSSIMDSRLQRLRFVERPQENAQPVIARTTVDGGLSEEQLRNWYLTTGDEDYN